VTLCNLNCPRVKVHLVTGCHAEALSRAAQGLRERGLWTLTSNNLPYFEAEESKLVRGESVTISGRVVNAFRIQSGLDYRLPESSSS